METIAAMFDTIQEEAAHSCNQSPVVLIPYANTLRIQHRLATVCPSHPRLIIFRILVCSVPGLDTISLRS